MSQELKFYQQTKNVSFPMTPEIYARMRQFLQQNNLMVTNIQPSASLDVPMLFNEVCAFGFEPTDALVAINTVFGPNAAVQHDIKDRFKSTFVNRMDQARQLLVSELLLNLPPNQIPSELGGSKQALPLRYLSTTNQLQNQAGNVPILKPNERKPRRWRKQADKTTVETAENEAAITEQCILTIRQTGLVSEGMERQLVAACNMNEELCYQTAITSTCPFVRGFPKIPYDFPQEKAVQTILQLRKNEMQLIKQSGFEAELVTLESDASLKPTCYRELDCYVVKCRLGFSPFSSFKLVFHMQDPADWQFMRPDFDRDQIPEQPLVIDGQYWKINTLFRGSYPLVLPFIDLESKYLSCYGKAVVLKFCYQYLSRLHKWNNQAVLQLLLALQDPQLEQNMRYCEDILQQTIQASTLNLKKYKPDELKESFFMEIAKRQGRRNNKDSNFQIAPLLYAFKTVDQAVPHVQTSIMEGDKFLWLEDTFSGFKAAHANKFMYKECALQPEPVIFELPEQPAAARNVKMMSQAQFDRVMQQRSTDQFNKFLRERQQLPVYQAREDLIRCVSANDVIIITAQTGSGKSTNVPQLLAECGFCKIVVTQPRRIAAVSLASRVAQESGLKLGKAVGYSVKGKAEYCDDTVVLYCTIGVLLRKVVGNVHELLRYTHLIVDEVHERSQETDVLLGILRAFFSTHRGPVPKLIIMSATVDGEKFAEYFKAMKVGRFDIEGKLHQLQIRHLDDQMDLKVKLQTVGKKQKRDDVFYDDFDEFDIDLDEPYEYKQNLDEIDDFCVNEQLIYEILRQKIYIDNESGNTIVFLPGMQEIQQLHNYLKNQQFTTRIEFVQCHSMVSMEQQQLLFRHSDTPRVVLATNIAEASITIPNVVAVIDTGLERQVKYYPKTRKNVFTTKFVSKESATQRAGRAGRTRDGKVFRTFLEKTWQKLDQHRKPEIQTAGLAGTCLQLLLLQGDQYQPHTFLQNLVDPPSAESIYANLKELLDADFIGYTQNAFIGDKTADGCGLDKILTSKSTRIFLTKFGADVAFLPIEPVYGRILEFSRLYGVGETLAKMAISVLSTGQTQIIKRLNASCNELERLSDHILLIKLLMKHMRGENTIRYEAIMGGLQSAKDTLYELLDDDYIEPNDIHLIVPIIQLAMWPNVCSLTNNDYIMVKNGYTKLRIHPGSLLNRVNCKLVVFNEQLVTKQAYMTTCSPGSAVALLMQCDDPIIDFRRKTLLIFGAEYQCNCVQAAILLRFVTAVKKFGIGREQIKALMEAEAK